MEKALLKTLGKMIYGIYILTSFYKKEVGGMVASWVSQVSYGPPMVMVAVHPNRFSHHLIDQSGYFALHLLSRNQTDLLERFKGPNPAAKFESISWSRGKIGCPILASCLAYVECEVKARYRPGNHTLFVGEIIDAHAFSDKETLSTFDYAGVYLGKD
jgi:flavin reductase (DIM6/NTAB) family NADH-FMN oxidoreductase RutF